MIHLLPMWLYLILEIFLNTLKHDHILFLPLIWILALFSISLFLTRVNHIKDFTDPFLWRTWFAHGCLVLRRGMPWWCLAYIRRRCRLLVQDLILVVLLFLSIREKCIASPWCECAICCLTLLLFGLGFLLLASIFTGQPQAWTTSTFFAQIFFSRIPGFATRSSIVISYVFFNNLLHKFDLLDIKFSILILSACIVGRL